MLTGSADSGCDTSDRLHRSDGAAVEWVHVPGLQPYPACLAAMKARAAAIHAGAAAEAVWLVEHPPLYTAGTSAVAGDLLAPGRFPVFDAGRGGQYTYHGPGQRVAYAMLDLTRRGRDVRCYVRGLEGWIIDTLAHFGVTGERRADRVGVWVARPDRGVGAEDKIAAIGVRVSRWVSFHGIALNVDVDLSHYDGIVPCGIRDRGVTSLRDLGVPAGMAAVDAALRQSFQTRFGPTLASHAPELDFAATKPDMAPGSAESAIKAYRKLEVQDESR